MRVSRVDWYLRDIYPSFLIVILWMDDAKWNILASYDLCNFCKNIFSRGSFKVVAVFLIGECSSVLQSREDLGNKYSEWNLLLKKKKGKETFWLLGKVFFRFDLNDLTVCKWNKSRNNCTFYKIIRVTKNWKKIFIYTLYRNNERLIGNV